MNICTQFSKLAYISFTYWSVVWGNPFK